MSRAVSPRLGVLGWPVAHSLSPRMQSAALAALGLDEWVYQALPVPPELFAETVRALPEAGFRGANVTIPHKEAALAVAESASPAARAIGAANTLVFDPAGGIAAENTDAPGLIEALGEAGGGSPRGLTVQVLGAGGSARAAVWALAQAGAERVLIWNRSPARAGELAGELGGEAVEAPRAADLLVNCTSVGLDPGVGEGEVLEGLSLNVALLGSYPVVMDLVYSGGEGMGRTALLGMAARHGARTVDGLEVLLAQGALSLEIWTGREAPREAMWAALRGPDSSAG